MSAPLDDQTVMTIRQRYAAGGLTMADLAQEYGISLTTVSFMVRGLTYRHLPGADPMPSARRRKLTPAQVVEIRRQYLADPYATYAALAARYGVNYNTIRYAVTGVHFKEITDPPPINLWHGKKSWAHIKNPIRGKTPPPPGPNTLIYRQRKQNLQTLAQTLADVVGQSYAMIKRLGRLEVVPLAEAAAQPLFVAHPKETGSD